VFELFIKLNSKETLKMYTTSPNAHIDTSGQWLSYNFKGPRAAANGLTSIKYVLVECLLISNWG